MAEATIDRLQIEINAKASNSVDGLEKLAQSIQKLKSSVGSGVDKLSGIASSLSNLNTSITSLKGKSGTITSLVSSLDKLNNVDTSKIGGKIESLKTSLNSLGSMSSEIKTLVNSLGNLAGSDTGNVSQNALKTEAAIAKAQATIDKSALTSAKSQQGLVEIAAKNNQIAESAKFAAEAEQSLNDAIARATSKSPVSTGTLPTSATRIPSATASEITGSGNLGLTESMESFSSSAKNASKSVKEVKDSTDSAKKSVSSFGESANNAFRLANLYAAYYILKRVESVLSGFITNITSYIENMNLFDVAMGSAAQSGEKLANSLQNVLGIDSGEAERYMGLFQQIDTSFGVTNKQAVTMSENLTQLGYDIASFYNISTATSFEKLESGITGQTKALRQLGIDTSQARLQQELYDLGIKAKVTDLNQADKAELRYIAIMKQTGNAQGDMARTIQTPANALRVLTAQLAIAGRAIGSIFIPALESILPPVIAAVEVIGDMASELASLAGFEMPKIDYSSLKDVTSEADDAATATSAIGDNADKSKKQIQNLIGGFDELNILDTSSTETSAGAGTDGTGSVLGGIDLPSYNALSTAVSGNIKKLKAEIMDFLDALKTDPLKVFSDALYGVNGAFTDLWKWLTKLDYADILTGISAAIMTYGLTKNPLLALAVGAITTALSVLLPQATKIDLLGGSLATLGLALVMKTLTGMPFNMALGISALATSGLVELLGKDNAIKLLATAVTALGVGLLTYKATGNLPLAVAVGAASAAVAGISLHFSDMKLASSLLAGVSAALLTFKWGEFSAGSAGLVGLGVAVASFAELNSFAPVLNAGLLGLAGMITGVGLAIKLGFGVDGAIALAVVGAIVGIGTAVWQASEDAKKADLESRFGSIALSAQDVEDVAKRITTTPWTVKIDAAIDAADKVKTFETTLKTEIETLNKLDWKVSVGIKLTKDEQSTYKSTITSFISDAKSYVQSQQYAVTLAINAILEPGTATYDNLTKFTNKYYSDTQAELDKLGTQLSNEVNKAFADNVLTEGEMINIQKIQAKMSELLQKIADQKYKATLTSLEMDTKGAEITADSFKALQAKIQSGIDEELKSAGTSKITLITQAQTKLEVDSKTNATQAKIAYDQTVSDIQYAYNKEKATLEISGLNVSLNTLNAKFKTEVAGASTIWSTNLTDAFNNAIKNTSPDPNSVKSTVTSLELLYNNELSKMNISDSTKSALKDLLKQIEPTETSLKEIRASALAAGQKVPEGINSALTQIETLKAISGDVDAIDYLIGQHLSTDPKFLETVNKAQQGGIKISDTFRDGLLSGKAATEKSANDLGAGTANSVVSGANNKVPDLTEAGKNTIQGLWDGMISKKKEMDPWMVTMSENPLKAFNEANGIHSPSTKFEESGENIVQGLWNGISTVWDKFTTWWEGLKLKTPHLEFTWESLDNYDNLAAKAAKKLGLSSVPTVSVDWYAQGGIFDSPTMIGVGEKGKEAVVPLSEDSEWIKSLSTQINKDTEKSSNSGSSSNANDMTKIALMAEQNKLLQALLEKDTTIKVNEKVLAKSVNKTNSNSGYNLGLQS